MKHEGDEKVEASCKECKYIFLAAFAVLIGFFFLTFLLRGESMTSSLSGNTTIMGEETTSAR